MRFLVRAAQYIFGLGLQVIGFVGGSDQVATWSSWLSAIHNVFSDPILYLAFSVLGTFILAYTFADDLTNYRIRNAGGPSHKEFPAKYENWDKVGALAVWQIAYLWTELEPHSPDTQQTRAYHLFRRLKEHIDKGLIPDLKKDSSGSWRDVTIDRQQLIDYCAKIGERPKFLFPERRSWLLRTFGKRRNEPTESEIRGFKTVYDLYLPALAQQGGLENVRQQMLAALRNGTAEGIARPRRYNLDWPYVFITAADWRRLNYESTFSERVAGGSEHFTHVRIRLKPT